MEHLEQLLAKNYGREPSSECRRAVLDFLSVTPSPRDNTGNNYTLHFIKALTKVGYEIFRQEPHSFSRYALSALIDFHESGISLAESLRRDDVIEQFLDQNRTNREDKFAFKNARYAHAAHLHLQMHLSQLLLDLDYNKLFETPQAWERGLKRAYEIGNSVGRQLRLTEEHNSASSFYNAGWAAFELFKQKQDLNYTENAYRASVAALLVSKKQKDRDEKLHQWILRQKAIISYSAFRSLREKLPKEFHFERQNFDNWAASNKEDLIRWSNRAYFSTQDYLREGEIPITEKANSLYDRAFVQDLLKELVDLPQLGLRCIADYKRFLQYVRKNELQEKVPNLVKIAENRVSRAEGCS